MHVVSEWQHADVLTKALPATLCRRRRVALMNLPHGVQVGEPKCVRVEWIFENFFIACGHDVTHLYIYAKKPLQ